MSFTLYVPKEMHLGSRSIEILAEKVRQVEGTHAFIVGGSLLREGQWRNRIESSLQAARINATFFIHSNGEPTTEHVKQAIEALNTCKADCVVAIGGGSVIDLAKVVSVGSVYKDCTLDDIPTMQTVQRLPLIAVPTTAGTGSEATKVTVITDVTCNVKKNPSHVALIPDVVILDPLLTMSLPKHITAYTGMDALAHAMEAYLSNRANVLTDYYAKESMKLIGEALPIVYENASDEVAREKMLLASYYGGIAFSNASTNLAHAAARPLGAMYGIPHGLCVALLLPYVISYGLDTATERYTNVANILGVQGGVQQLVPFIEQYNETFHIWEAGRRYINMEMNFEKQIPTLVRDALAGNGITTNWKVPNENDVEQLYRTLWWKLKGTLANSI